MSCAELALARLEPGHAAHGAIQQLQEVAHRGRSHIAQLLRFSRPSEVTIEAVDLDGAVETAARLIRPLLGADVHIDLALHAGEARILADRGQLDHILFNLANNARHAMPNGGNLHIATRILERKASPSTGG